MNIYQGVGYEKDIINCIIYFTWVFSTNYSPDNRNVKNITYHKKSRTGIEEVKYEKYYKYGQKESEETFKNGKLDGLWTE